VTESTIALGLVWFLVFVFSTTCHEAAHALAAKLGGDPTAYEGGQVTLDPLPHIKREPWGMVLIPIVSFIQFGSMLGWASAPYDPRWGARYPRRQALMSLAGPMANFALALVCFAVMKVLLGTGTLTAPARASLSSLVVAHGEASTSALGFLAMALSVGLALNVTLGLFNLLPIPPLDGAGVLEGLFPKSLGRLFSALREQPLFGLVGLVVAIMAFRRISPGIGPLLRLLYPDDLYF
jgi:Zn-dependent protease